MGSDEHGYDASAVIHNHLLVAWLQRSTASAEIAQIFAALLLRVFGHQTATARNKWVAVVEILLPGASRIHSRWTPTHQAVPHRAPPARKTTHPTSAAMVITTPLTASMRLIPSYSWRTRSGTSTHFVFGLNFRHGVRARHPVRMSRHRGRDGCGAASASRLSRRRSFFFMPTT